MIEVDLTIADRHDGEATDPVESGGHDGTAENNESFTIPRHNGHITIESLTLPKRDNLQAAVRHLRFPDCVRKLWIDALCINQSDVAERSKQVSQMSQIYSPADMVIIWLGEAAHNSDKAFQCMRNVCRTTSSENKRYPHLTRWETFKAAFAPYSHFNSSFVSQLEALNYSAN